MKFKLEDFIEKYKGIKNVGNTPGNKGQCTGLVMVYIKELQLSHIWGHAKDLFQNALSNQYEKIENAPNIYPNEGDIICWNSTTGGGYGHVAIVVSSDPEKDTVEVFEQNNPFGNPPRIYTYSNWRGIIGWLNPYLLEDVENDPLESSVTIAKLEERIQGLLDTKDIIQSKLETLGANNEALVKKINEMDIKAVEFDKKYLSEVKLLTEQRDKCTKDFVSFTLATDGKYEEYDETIKDLERRVIQLQKPEKGGAEVDKNILWESVKDPLRLLVLGVIPFAIAYFTELPFEWAGFTTLLLKGLDRYLHNAGKELKDDKLILGLTRF